MADETKKALADALMKLLESRSLSKVTIKDLVAECGVNRQTFYYHFQDIHDLVAWMYKSEAIKVISEANGEENWQEAIKQVCHMLRENKIFVINTYHSISRDALEEYLYTEVYDLLFGIIKEHNRKDGLHVKMQDVSAIAHFYKYAFCGAILEWIKRGMIGNPDILIDEAYTMLHGTMESALKRFCN